MSDLPWLHPVLWWLAGVLTAQPTYLGPFLCGALRWPQPPGSWKVGTQSLREGLSLLEVIETNWSLATSPSAGNPDAPFKGFIGAYSPHGGPERGPVACSSRRRGSWSPGGEGVFPGPPDPGGPVPGAG